MPCVFTMTFTFLVITTRHKEWRPRPKKYYGYHIFSAGASGKERWWHWFLFYYRVDLMSFCASARELFTFNNSCLHGATGQSLIPSWPAHEIHWERSSDYNGGGVKVKGHQMRFNFTYSWFKIDTCSTYATWGTILFTYDSCLSF